jgi:hypothetical protein
MQGTSFGGRGDGLVARCEMWANFHVPSQCRRSVSAPAAAVCCGRCYQKTARRTVLLRHPRIPREHLFLHPVYQFRMLRREVL